MKRYIVQAVILVVIVVLAGAAFYFNDSSEPQPPPPDPTPVAEIVGPRNVKVGDLVVYTTGSKAKFTKWTTVPDGPQVKVTNEGQVLVIVFDLSGDYHIVLASGAGNGVELAKIPISVDGEGPGPPRPPPIPPNPPTPPDPSVTGWEKWTTETVLSTVDYPTLKQDATQLSGQLSSFAAQIAAGAIKDCKEARVKLRQITNKTLGANAKHWVEFSNAFAKRAEKLTELKQYQQAYAAVAKGLESVAASLKNPYDIAIGKSKDDKKPVLVVVVSKGCPPCDKLKLEWLPNSKAYGDARIVMLDRLSHKDVVEAVSVRGFGGRIKVPQVHILRYVNGTWQQFSRVGYTSFGSLDRWVKNVFAWEEKP